MKRVLLGAWLLVAALPLQAEKIYRWVDAEGGVHYSGTPPPGQKVEEDDLNYQRDPDPAAAAAAQQRMQKEIQDNRDSQVKAAEEAATKGKEQADRSRLCDQARSVVAALEGKRGVRMPQPDGSVRAMTQEEWDAKKQAALEAERSNCAQ